MTYLHVARVFSLLQTGDIRVHCALSKRPDDTVLFYATAVQDCSELLMRTAVGRNVVEQSVLYTANS
jgi:hypothetical protein